MLFAKTKGKVIGINAKVLRESLREIRRGRDHRSVIEHLSSSKERDATPFDEKAIGYVDFDRMEEIGTKKPIIVYGVFKGQYNIFNIF